MTETLGTALRAGRLRFGYVSEVDAYARLSLVGDKVRLQVVTPSHLQNSRTLAEDAEGYAMWYSTDVPDKEQARYRRTIARAVKETKYWQPGCVIWLSGRGRVLHGFDGKGEKLHGF